MAMWEKVGVRAEAEWAGDTLGRACARGRVTTWERQGRQRRVERGLLQIAACSLRASPTGTHF